MVTTQVNRICVNALDMVALFSDYIFPKGKVEKEAKMKISGSLVKIN